MKEPLNLQGAIKNLQRYLRTISFYDERINRVPIDGIYGSETQNAVREFQRTRGLEPNGIVDKSTWDMIFDEFSEILLANDRSDNINLFPTSPQGYEAALGETSSFVAIIQLILRELSLIYDTFPEIEITGTFDPPTEEAAKEFQRISGLEVTGRVDLKTWNRLIRDFSNYAR